MILMVGVILQGSCEALEVNTNKPIDLNGGSEESMYLHAMPSRVVFETRIT